MNSLPPSVSVLMPVYNAAPYLGKAIISILGQDLNNFELIIIDDGSTDNSWQLIQEIAKTDSRIKSLTRANKGISATRNELIDMASSNLIAWMDADDISLPNRLSVQSSYLNDNKDYVAVGCRTKMIDHEDAEICDWPMLLTHKEIDEWHINGRGGAIIFPSSMMRKNSVKSVGGFNNKLTGAEDLDLFLKLAEIGKVANIDQLCFFYRQHIDSICHGQNKQIAIDTQSVINEAALRRGLAAKILSTKTTNVSKQEIYNKWTWWSLKAGNKKTARKYAVKALLESPFSLNNWKALFCALRGY